MAEPRRTRQGARAGGRAASQAAGPRERRGPLGREYTDGYGRRIYQSDVPGSTPVVMEREYDMPEGHVQQPDFYLDPTQRRSFIDYMLGLRDTGENGRQYYRGEANAIDRANRTSRERLFQYYLEQMQGRR